MYATLVGMAGVVALAKIPGRAMLHSVLRQLIISSKGFFKA